VKLWTHSQPRKPT